MKYICTATKFSKSSGKLVPTMNKSSELASKTALKNYIGDQIDSADADSNLVNIQFLVRVVKES